MIYPSNSLACEYMYRRLSPIPANLSLSSESQTDQSDKKALFSQTRRHSSLKSGWHSLLCGKDFTPEPKLVIYQVNVALSLRNSFLRYQT